MGITFRGNMCRFRSEVWEQKGRKSPQSDEILCHGLSCEDHNCSSEFQLQYKPGKENYLDCCDVAINGGQWLVNPTPGGNMFIRQWLALLQRDSVVQEKMWNGSAGLDQIFLGESMTQVHNASTPLYRWDPATLQYVNYAALKRDGIITRSYVSSIFRWQTRCHGTCGMMGSNIAYRYSFDPKLTCIMPQKMWLRMVSIHLNCGSDVNEKRGTMYHLLNSTYNEETFNAERNTTTEIGNPWPGLNGGKNFIRQRIVFPEW